MLWRGYIRIGGRARDSRDNDETGVRPRRSFGDGGCQRPYLSGPKPVGRAVETPAGKEPGWWNVDSPTTSDRRRLVGDVEGGKEGALPSTSAICHRKGSCSCGGFAAFVPEGRRVAPRGIGRQSPRGYGSRMIFAFVRTLGPLSVISTSFSHRTPPCCG